MKGDQIVALGKGNASKEENKEFYNNESNENVAKVKNNKQHNFLQGSLEVNPSNVIGSFFSGRSRGGAWGARAPTLYFRK